VRFGVWEEAARSGLWLSAEEVLSRRVRGTYRSPGPVWLNELGVAFTTNQERDNHDGYVGFTRDGQETSVAVARRQSIATLAAPGHGRGHVHRVRGGRVLEPIPLHPNDTDYVRTVAQALRG
jgi:hypothetical protein